MMRKGKSVITVQKIHKTVEKEGTRSGAKKWQSKPMIRRYLESKIL